jgi:hypothetical protein
MQRFAGIVAAVAVAQARLKDASLAHKLNNFR